LPNTYYYINSRGNVVLDSNEDPTPGREYYLIKANELNDRLNKDVGNQEEGRGYIGLYVPGKYYYKSISGDYVLDTTANGSDINDENKNYYMQS